MLKAADSLLLPMPERGKAKLLLSAEGYEPPPRRGNEGKEQPSQNSCYFPQISHHTKEGAAASSGFLQGTSPAWWQEQTGISSFTLGQQI